MPQVNKALRDRAREVPIEDEIARRAIRLRGNGAERHGPCPVCGGDDRFSINTEKQVWFCRKCNTGGDVIALVKHLDHVDFQTACQTLAGEPGAFRPRVNGNGKSRDAVGAAAGATVAVESVVAEYLYHAEDGTLVFATERIEYWNPAGTSVLKDGKPKKSFRQKRPDPDRPGEWINNVDGVRVIPYRLPQVIEAIANGHPIVVVEGEAKVDLLAEWNVATTCNAGGAGKWKSEHSAFLKGADCIVIPDNDEAGYRHLEQVGASLHGVAARVRVLMLPGLPPKGDIVDWAKAGGTREQLDALIEQAPDWVPREKPDAETKAETKIDAKSREDELIGALAAMEPGIAFARARKEAASEFNVNLNDIDAEIRRYREDQAAAPLYGHWETEPWPEPVEGDSLLRDIIRRFKRQVVFRSPNDDPLAIALWLMFSWVHDEAAIHSPILIITSAESGCGKSTVLGLLSLLMPRCISVVEITDAALFRSIKMWDPSFAIDEFDEVLKDNNRQSLRSVINSGHARGQGVIRCVGDDSTPELFPTFAPKCIGMIGRNLPPATASRAIFIQLEPRRSDEPIEDFKQADDPELADLRGRLRRWALDNADPLRDAKPVLPEGFYNRRKDNWRLQLAIAELAGEDWAEKARAAAINIDRASDTSSIGVRLLADIRRIRDEYGGDCILSATLVAKLKEDDEGPWAELHHGKGLAQNSLAALLGGGGGKGRRGRRGYGIHTQNVQPPGECRGKGYKWTQFEDAWSRYLTPTMEGDPPLDSE